MYQCSEKLGTCKEHCCFDHSDFPAHLMFTSVKNKKHYQIGGRKFYWVDSHTLTSYVAYRVDYQNLAANICFGMKKKI